jgi:chitinase
MRRRSTFVGVAAALSVALIATLPGTANASPATHAPAPVNRDSGYKKVGYFIQWGIYGRQYYVKNLDTSGQAANLTHIDYAFAGVDSSLQCASVDPWADYQRPVSAQESVDGVADVAGQPLSGNFNQLRKLKLKYPKLKVLLSIGGWTLSANYSDAALTDASRKKLVSSCISTFLSTGVFDGFDLDWEWPGSDGNAGNVIRPQDKQNFTLLAAEFRKQLDATGKHYDLSAFLPAAPAKIDAGFEANKIFKYLDFGTVQGYDFHGPYEATTNQQSALKAPRDTPVANDFSDTQAVGDWLHRGAPARQLVLGVPFYGQGWTGVPDGGTAGLFQPSTGPAPATWQAGNEDYHALKVLAQSGTYAVHRDTRDGFAWLYDGTNFWTYDDPQVIAQKTAYIRQQHLGGAMAWSLDGDTANGELMTAIHTGLNPPPHHGHR